MYKRHPRPKSDLKINNSFVGETIEQKVRRIIISKEPIKDGAPLIYTERKDGVKPEYDIRTDRMEQAIEIADKTYKAHAAKRKNPIGEDAKKGMEAEAKTNKGKDGGAEPIQATESK